MKAVHRDKVSLIYLININLYFKTKQAQENKPTLLLM
jgi:hypothetical protein